MSELQTINNVGKYERLMEVAISSDADPAKLGQLMDLQDRWEVKQAKQEFNAALAGFQSECPIIEKTAKGHNCKYAPLPTIIAVIKPILHKFGLSYRFKQKVENGLIKVSCVLTHIAGHSESTEMEAEADASGSKNAIQAIASANAYLQRYTLIGVCGIASADPDDDGQKANQINIVDLISLNTLVRESFNEINEIKLSMANEDFDQAAGYWHDFTLDEKRMLWRAPTKGGIFTTEEREIIKTNNKFASEAP